MAESDFYSYSSIYSDFGFSKGPKSVYYGVGDEMLPGAILNVPQTDEDDEWGRTQRITDERTYDFIAKIYKTLFDPYNSIPDVSLVPGEAGSEINVAKSMIKLIGRSGIDTGVFDLANSTMHLCGVTLDGVNEYLRLGDAELSSTYLSFNNLFGMSHISGETFGLVTYGNVFTRWYDDTSAPTFDISVNSKVFSFGIESGDPTFSLPVGGVLKVPGEIFSNDINPAANLTYNIGTSELKFNNIFAGLGNFDTVCGGSVRTNNIYPQSTSTTLGIGNSSLTDTINIRLKALNVYDIDSSIPCIKIYEDSLSGYTGRIVDIGDPAGNHIINFLVKTGSSGTACGGFNVFTAGDPTKAAFGVSEFYAFLNRSLIPGEPDSVALGVPYSRFLETHTKQIYADDVYVAKGIFNNQTSSWYVCGPQLYFKDSSSEETNMTIGGALSAARFFKSIYTTNIYPYDTDVYNLGLSGNRFNEIHAQSIYSQNGMTSNSTTSWTLSGPNLDILVGGVPKVGICANHIAFRDLIYTRSIFPIYNTGVYLGDINNAGFEALILRDQATGNPTRISLCSGALYIG